MELVAIGESYEKKGAALDDVLWQRALTFYYIPTAVLSLQYVTPLTLFLLHFLAAMGGTEDQAGMYVYVHCSMTLPISAVLSALRRQLLGYDG